jgi:hypothetical protein
VAEENDAGNALVGRVVSGEVDSDVSQGRGPQQSIYYGVHHNIGIAPALKPLFKRYLYAPQNEGAFPG